MSRRYQRYKFEEIAPLGSLLVFQGSFKDVSRVFQGCFKGV